MKCLILIYGLLALSGCTMGTRYYLPDGKGGSRLAAVQSADTIGDQKVIITPQKITFILSTPLNNGSITYRQRAILNASKTAVLAIVTEPAIAESSASKPLKVAGDATAKGLQSAGTLIGAAASAAAAIKVVP